MAPPSVSAELYQNAHRRISSVLSTAYKAPPQLPAWWSMKRTRSTVSEALSHTSPPPTLSEKPFHNSTPSSTVAADTMLFAKTHRRTPSPSMIVKYWAGSRSLRKLSVPEKPP